MKIYKCFGKGKLSLLWAGVLLSLAALFIFSEECKDGAVYGISLCINILVPSLFPFIVLSNFIAESKVFESVGKFISPLTTRIFRLRGICMVPVLLSLAGGYPVGARAIAVLSRNSRLTQREQEILPCICCCAGPGFLITYIGISLLQSKQSGIILLTSQIISILILCVISRFFISKDDLNEISDPVSINSVNTGYSFISSVVSGIKSTAAMCGFVVIFSVVCNILTSGCNADSIVGLLAVCVLEITTGVSLISKQIGLDILSILVGFGGLCVHLQIFTELKKVQFSIPRFYIFRFLQAALGFVITKILLLCFPVSTEVFSSVKETPTLTLYSGFAGFCALVLCSIIFLISIGRKKQII